VCGIAVGCGKLIAPARGWVRHSSNDVTMVGCDTSSEQWELRCHGNAWMTDSGHTAASINCTQGAPYVVTFRGISLIFGFDVSSKHKQNGARRETALAFASRNVTLVLRLLCPRPVGRRNYKMKAVSVRPSVACLELIREQKGSGSPKLAEWKPITQVTREPI